MTPFSLISIICAISFLILLITLHFLKKELDPSWRMISEYEMGKYGWLMQVAFVMLGVSCFALLLSLGNSIPLAAKILLVINSLSLVGAAIFVTDPITTPRDQVSRTGNWHTICGVLFIFGFPITATVISSALLTPGIFILLLWVGLFGFIGATSYFASKKRIGSEAKIGWPNRIMMMLYVLWIISTLLTLK